MADPRFYDNQGPFGLAAVCAKIGAQPPGGGDSPVADLASLGGAGPRHLAFFLGGKKLAADFTRSRAGFCLTPHNLTISAPPGMTLVPCADVASAWVAAASLFYPAAVPGLGMTMPGIAASARLGEGVVLGADISIGEHAEIGAGARIGAGTVIGRGVTIGKNGEIGSHVSISHAHIGDRVRLLPGARIGQPGFGFASGANGHVRIPQLGRVIIQDDVDIGAGSCVDRGALGDTVIGEGAKIDNLVQVGHNVEIGRFCVIAALSGIAGSAVLEDWVVVGGQSGIGDHCRIGAKARLGGHSGVPSGAILEGGKDYSGFPAKPIREWAREILVLGQLVRRRSKDGHD